MKIRDLLQDGLVEPELRLILINLLSLVFMLKGRRTYLTFGCKSSMKSLHIFFSCGMLGHESKDCDENGGEYLGGEMEEGFIWAGVLLH